MELGLRNQVMIVTGGASGIGEAMVRAFIQEGAKVAFADRDESRGKNLTQALTATGGEALYVAADLTVEADCRKVMEETVGTFGRIDCLVNNAGTNDGVGIDASPERFMASLRKNLVHYFTMAHFCFPQLKKNRGAILNISSKTAVTGQGGTSGYAAAKGGILALTREWAADFCGYGIRVNAIVPAEVKTPQYERWIQKFDHPEEKLRAITSRIPLGERMTLPEEIAAMAVFLVSEPGRHITGQHIYVDGGYTHLDRALQSRGASQ